MEALTVSITFNVLLYIIIGLLCLKMIRFTDEDHIPLSKADQAGYKGFALLMSLFWPIMLVIIVISDEDGK
jgi:hypothetical protein